MASFQGTSYYDWRKNNPGGTQDDYLGFRQNEMQQLEAAAAANRPDPNRQLMGQEYFKDEEFLTWRDDASKLWESEHGIDPRTGAITGPMGQIPAGIALKWQGIHDQTVWNARNRMAQDALRYAQGATGLMSSYRAGGGAAIQSNVYGNLSNVRMNQAQMLQPMDLLADYRRDQIARAGSAGRTESTIGTALQGLGAVLSVVPGLNVVGAALAVGGGALAGYGNSRQNASMIRAGAGGQMYGGQQQGIGAPMSLMNRGGGQDGGGWNQQDTADLNRITGDAETAGLFKDSGQIGPPAPNKSDMVNISGMTGSGNFFGESAGAGQAMSAQLQPDQQGSQKQVAGGQMAIPPVVGANGSFAPASYAQHAAATAMDPPSMQLALSEHIAGQISDDPSWSLITMKIDRELMLRTYGGAA